MNSNLILKVKNLNVELGGEKIINNLSFQVKEGEILTILGPNGAGKTVLLKTLLGILPYQGTIEWQKGIKVGYVPQRLPFIKDIPLTVREFLKLKINSENATKRVLELVGIKNEISEKEISKLSSGQFQRILVGWGLLGNPQVLLFDEPMAGIDISGQESIYDLLKNLQKEKGFAVLLVSHDLSVVYKFSSNVLCLNKKVLCYGPPQEILTPENLAQLYGGQIKFYQHFYRYG
ncbi:metal ABC transporter ATP-binding protein [bacterium]|nr:metal ABC transporter ATP-binding protein [bacterium]